MSTLGLIRSDFARWKEDVGLARAFSQEGLWITVVYRVRHRLRSDPPVPGAWLWRALLFPLAKFLKVLLGTTINPSIQIGPGFLLVHVVSVYLGGRAVVGSDCSVFHEVTIGPGGIASMDYPVIGDRVRIFPGAKVLGGITIGDDAVIGANSVVIEDVPAGAVVAGNPARVVRVREKGGDEIGADSDEAAPNAT